MPDVASGALARGAAGEHDEGNIRPRRLVCERIVDQRWIRADRLLGDQHHADMLLDQIAQRREVENLESIDAGIFPGNIQICLLKVAFETRKAL